jgi:hypothetical protein
MTVCDHMDSETIVMVSGSTYTVWQFVVFLEPL